MKRRMGALRPLRSPLPPRAVLAEDFSLLLLPSKRFTVRRGKPFVLS